MVQMKGRRKTRDEAVAEYLAGDVSYRELGARYGISSSTLNRWVREHGREMGIEKEAIERVAGSLAAVREETPVEVGRLKRELEEARLYNKLLEAMIEIAEEQMGIVIRKKSGARQR